MVISRFTQRNLVLSLLITLSLVLSFSAQAQAEVTISIAVASYNADTYEDAIEEFEAQHPGVRVYIEETDYGVPFYYFNEVETYLDDVASYAEIADVLLINGELAPEATRAGYFLDMSPLVNTDTTLDINDFYPTLWESFQWDGGIWGIPVAGDIVALFYDPVIFDEAGLAYPNENWSVSDFAFAIETLAQFDDDGEILMPGLMNAGSFGGMGMFLMSMLGEDVVDDSVFPSVPDFSNPEIESLLTAWSEIRDTGAMNFPQNGYNSNELPFAIGPSFLGATFNGESVKLPAPFPGGRVGVIPTGYAISAGTQNPELAYELITFLTTSAEVTDSFFSEIPARRSMAEIESEDGLNFSDQVTPELEAFIQQGLENGISISEARFSRYLAELVAPFSPAEIDIEEAIAGLEDVWTERLALADEIGQTTNFTVIPPPPPPVLADGEASISFQLSMTFSPLPNNDEWETFFDEFAASEPEIGFVDWDGGFPGNFEEIAQENDCFYLPYNIVQSIDPSLLVSLDPLMFADPNLDMNDFLPNVLSLASRDGLIWGFPIMLQPLVMNYNTDIFAAAGVPLPENAWTTDEFELALRDLDAYIDEDVYPFTSRSFDNTYLLSLIAAYGGIPVDMRTQPVTYNFTDPANIEAIRQVLNLVVDGYIEYSELTNRDFNNMSFNSNDIPIYTQPLNGANFAFSNPEFEDPYEFVTFPIGAQYSAVTFEIGLAYISANTPYIDACYRLISEIASRPDLFFSMPARQSLVDMPEVVANQSQDAVDFYTGLSELMQQPNVLVLNGANTTNQYFEAYWLNRVFDQYVAGEIDDLELALAEAEEYTLSFQECSGGISPFQEGVDDPETYFDQYVICATSADPLSADFFDF